MAFLLLHCPYNPDRYSGHRIEQLPAKNWDEAKQMANDILQRRTNTFKWEYRLIEVTEDTGYRLHDVEKQSWLVGGKY